MPQYTSVQSHPTRHLCTFSECSKTQAFTPVLFKTQGNASKHQRQPRSCSTSMCCDKFSECLKTQAFAPILSDISAQAANTSIHPDLARHLCVARDVESASRHKHLPRSSSTSTPCERFKECFKTPAFTPIFFAIHAARENTNVCPDLV